jgi:hypothetical protein
LAHPVKLALGVVELPLCDVDAATYATVRQLDLNETTPV